MPGPFAPGADDPLHLQRYDGRRRCSPRRYAEDARRSVWFYMHRLPRLAHLPGAYEPLGRGMLTNGCPLHGRRATICRIVPRFNSDLIQLSRLRILSHCRASQMEISRTPQSVHVIKRASEGQVPLACREISRLRRFAPSLEMTKGGGFVPLDKGRRLRPESPATCGRWRRGLWWRCRRHPGRTLQAARRAHRSCRTCRARRHAQAERDSSRR